MNPVILEKSELPEDDELIRVHAELESMILLPVGTGIVQLRNLARSLSNRKSPEIAQWEP